jgi:hypothetical protein
MILNSFQEPLAEIKDITGIVVPGLRLDGSRQQPGQRHRDRFSVFKREQQRYGIAALVEKLELYRLAIVKGPAHRELAAVNYHGLGRRPSMRAGVDFAAIWSPQAASELKSAVTSVSNACPEERLSEDRPGRWPGLQNETASAGHRYIYMDITHLCGKMQSPTRL